MEVICGIRDTTRLYTVYYTYYLMKFVLAREEGRESEVIFGISIVVICIVLIRVVLSMPNFNMFSGLIGGSVDPAAVGVLTSHVSPSSTLSPKHL